MPNVVPGTNPEMWISWEMKEELGHSLMRCGMQVKGGSKPATESEPISQPVGRSPHHNIYPAAFLWNHVFAWLELVIQGHQHKVCSLLGPMQDCPSHSKSGARISSESLQSQMNTRHCGLWWCIVLTNNSRCVHDILRRGPCPILFGSVLWRDLHPGSNWDKIGID